jgi:hypothetical protein
VSAGGGRGISGVGALVKAARAESPGVDQSIRYLQAQSPRLSGFASIDDLIGDLVDSEDPALEALLYHIGHVRTAVARQLWPRQLFVAATVLDELVLRACNEGAADPVRWVLQFVRTRRLDRPGFVLYPLTSFGFLYAGLLHAFTPVRVRYFSKRYGIAVTPQLNQRDRVHRFLQSTATDFEVAKRIPIDLVDHWLRSTPTRWLERNPLLAARIRSLPGLYYDNQFFLVGRLRVAATALAMFESMQPSRSTGVGARFSSSMTNNFETRDIKHYLVFYDHQSVNDALGADRVPMNLNRALLSELSQLDIEVDPDHWKKRRYAADGIVSALERTYEQYLSYRLGAKPLDPTGRVVTKMYEATDFFRRSLVETEGNWAATVALATAFEMILTDSYAGGVGERIERRSASLLRGRRDKRALVDSVAALYERRSRVVHQGRKVDDVDLRTARRSFTLAFAELSRRLDARGLAPVTSSPIGDLTDG